MTTATVAPDPGLVPELLITDLDESLDFWCRLCGFSVLYHRIHEGFAYIANGSAHVMLEQAGAGRNWITGPLERPLGRGINFQVSVPSIEPLVKALDDGDWPLFLAPETKWYRSGDHLDSGGNATSTYIWPSASPDWPSMVSRTRFQRSFISFWPRMVLL